MIAVRGTVAPGFESVRDEFAAALAAEPADPGAQLAVYLRGEPVVDLWGGDDVAGDTVTVVYSISKAAASLVVALLVQEGTLDLDAPVTTLPFPLTLRQLMGHRAGLIALDGGITVDVAADDRRFARELARQRPFWVPGSAYGYHALGFGALASAYVEQVTGQTIQEIYRARWREPFGLDLFLGLPPDEEPRFRPVQAAVTPRLRDLDAAPLSKVAFTEPADLVGFANDPRVRALGSASFGGTGSARGVAQLFAAAVTGLDGQPPLLRPATITEFARPYSLGTDLVTGNVDRFGLGFEKYTEKFFFMPPEALAHGGAAGALGWGDRESGIAYGYVRRRFASGTLENEQLGRAVVDAARTA